MEIADFGVTSGSAFWYDIDGGWALEHFSPLFCEKKKWPRNVMAGKLLGPYGLPLVEEQQPSSSSPMTQVEERPIHTISLIIRLLENSPAMCMTIVKVLFINLIPSQFEKCTTHFEHHQSNAPPGPSQFSIWFHSHFMSTTKTTVDILPPAAAMYSHGFGNMYAWSR